MSKAIAAAFALGLFACAPAEPVGGRAGEPAGALFVAGKFGNTLSRIDLASGRETVRVETCANPHERAGG
mgnify:CR=1 FL=1